MEQVMIGLPRLPFLIVKGGSNSGDRLNLRENPYLVVTKLTENATNLFFYQNCKK
jgi:hypothetical protein